MKISLIEAINTMFPAMKYGLKNGFYGKKNGFGETVKFFIYDLANPIFNDFSPKFFVSENVQRNPKYKDISKLPYYTKDKIYKFLNNNSMIVHEEHMTPNKQFQKVLLECNEPRDFEDFIRNNYAIAIITKDENQKLDKGGFKSNRANLEQAFIAYEKVGITIKQIYFNQQLHTEATDCFGTDVKKNNYSNNDIEWEESFNKTGDGGISYFEEHFGYARSNKTVNSNDIKAVLCHQYPILINSSELLQKVLIFCNGKYANKGKKVREFIYNNRHLIKK